MPVLQLNRSTPVLPSPLAPDPIRVQAFVRCLFSTNRNSMAYLSIYLIIQLSNSIGANSKWKYLLSVKRDLIQIKETDLWLVRGETDPWLVPGENERGKFKVYHFHIYLG